MRPPKPPKERKSGTITVYIEPWLADYIAAQARHRGQDKSGMCREWIIKQVRAEMADAREQFRNQPKQGNRYNSS